MGNFSEAFDSIFRRNELKIPPSPLEVFLQTQEAKDFLIKLPKQEQLKFTESYKYLARNGLLQPVIKVAVATKEKGDPSVALAFGFFRENSSVGNLAGLPVLELATNAEVLIKNPVSCVWRSQRARAFYDEKNNTCKVTYLPERTTKTKKNGGGSEWQFLTVHGKHWIPDRVETALRRSTLVTDSREGDDYVSLTKVSTKVPSGGEFNGLLLPLDMIKENL
jgi:hypothetical protein